MDRREIKGQSSGEVCERQDGALGEVGITRGRADRKKGD